MKIVRYFLVGGVAAAVDIGVFGILTKGFGLPWFPVAFSSFTLATAINYWLSIRHVFISGVRFRRRREMTLVFFVSGIGLVLNQGILWLLIDRWSWDVIVAKIVATGCVFFWNYGARIRFIFRSGV